ncbi:MAG: insulinase family protein [Pirellula sp.]|jgi:predicted Zn-dependent peptidase|nr:insulinase family protein [Pirellula sp.]
MQFRHEILDNGLEIVAEINPDAFSQSLGYFVRTGSRDEVPEIAGVSHFLEHMVFKGTPTRSSLDVNRMLDDLGSQSNAYTSEEQTVYYMSVLPEHQLSALDLLTDLMRPTLRREDFDTEKQVILEEIAMYDDQPPYGAMERAMEEYFGDHPLATRVLGTRQTVSDLTAEAMRAYHEQRYAPNNLCLVAAGAVDFDALVKETAVRTRLWTSVQTHRKRQPPVLRSSSVELVHPPATQQYTLEFSPGPGIQDPQRYVNRILASILGDDSGSRLFWELTDKGLADLAVTYTSEFEDCGIFGIYLACAPEQQNENWERIQFVLADAKANPITERELELAKNKVRSGMILASERPSNRLFSVGNGWLTRRKYESVREATENYQRVSLEQVQSAFEQLAQRPRVRVSVGPESGNTH